MLHIPWTVILCNHNIKKKKNQKNSIFELCKEKSCISRLRTNALGDPLPPSPNNYVRDLCRVKNCIIRLRTNALGDPPPPSPNIQIRRYHVHMA